MEYNLQSRQMARASPVHATCSCDPPVAVRSEQEVLQQRPRLQLKKQVDRKNRMRFATWNIGTMTGKGREIADALERRKVAIACVQETKWTGSSTNELGAGYKLYYCGEMQGRNGVGVILDEDLKNKVVKVTRESDRLMCVKLVTEDGIMNVISAYVPQQGCTEEEKDKFGESLEDLVRQIPEQEEVIIGADLNGHVSESANGFEANHGGKGYGVERRQGHMVVDQPDTGCN